MRRSSRCSATTCARYRAPASRPCGIRPARKRGARRVRHEPGGTTRFEHRRLPIQNDLRRAGHAPAPEVPHSPGSSILHLVPIVLRLRSHARRRRNAPPRRRYAWKHPEEKGGHGPPSCCCGSGVPLSMEPRWILDQSFGRGFDVSAWIVRLAGTSRPPTSGSDPHARNHRQPICAATARSRLTTSRPAIRWNRWRPGSGKASRCT